MAGDFEYYTGIVLVACLVLEQVICLLYMPYLGRFGITIDSAVQKVSIETILARFMDKGSPKKLIMHKNYNTLYFKNRFTLMTLLLGICVCAVRIMERDENTVKIDVKMCPFLFSFFAFAMLHAAISVVMDGNTATAFFKRAGNIFVFLLLMYTYYKMLIARVARLCVR